MKWSHSLLEELLAHLGLKDEWVVVEFVAATWTFKDLEVKDEDRERYRDLLLEYRSAFSRLHAFEGPNAAYVQCAKKCLPPGRAAALQELAARSQVSITYETIAAAELAEMEEVPAYARFGYTAEVDERLSLFEYLEPEITVYDDEGDFALAVSAKLHCYSWLVHQILAMPDEIVTDALGAAIAWMESIGSRSSTPGSSSAGAVSQQSDDPESPGSSEPKDSVQS